MDVTMSTCTTPTMHTPLNSSFPVFLPYKKCLWLPKDQFEQYIAVIIQDAYPYLYVARDEFHNPWLVRTVPKGKNPLAELFFEIKRDQSSSDLKKLLEKAWEESPITTLKIIFNTRSIHLGNGAKVPSYRALGWLAEHHPITFLRNIQWMVRPVISNPNDDIQFGISHGCWKDLLDILRLATYDQLKIDSDFSCLIGHEGKNVARKRRERVWDKQEAKKLRQTKIKEHHKYVVEKLENDLFYEALHVTVARLFAEQLNADMLLYCSSNPQDTHRISVAAKWTPSHSESMDKHTFVLSTIAEIIYPSPEEICTNPDNRELYLRTARDILRRQYISPLRKALALVEHNVAAETFSYIDYERVPNIAMEKYCSLFTRKDLAAYEAHFIRQFERELKPRDRNMPLHILIRKAQTVFTYGIVDPPQEENLNDIKLKVKNHVIRQAIDKQWHELVQRTKDSRTFESSIAVGDISYGARWQGLEHNPNSFELMLGFSLLVAEVAAKPFGGGFIELDQRGRYAAVGGPEDQRHIAQKVQEQNRHSVDDLPLSIVPMFEDIILPMAIHYNISPQRMAKKVFVFSARPFHQAQGNHGQRWDMSYDRIKMNFAYAGYDMPELIFWNFDAVVPTKPIRMEHLNTTLVSGYSQQMFDSFLDTGGFDDVETNVQGSTGTPSVFQQRSKINSMTIVDKATSHEAYSMLELVD